MILTLKEPHDSPWKSTFFKIHSDKINVVNKIFVNTKQDDMKAESEALVIAILIKLSDSHAL